MYFFTASEAFRREKRHSRGQAIQAGLRGCKMTSIRTGGKTFLGFFRFSVGGGSRVPAPMFPTLLAVNGSRSWVLSRPAQSHIRISLVLQYVIMPKLTLSVDPAVVARAKKYAKQHGVSVSKMLETYLASEPRPAALPEPPPVLRSLRGILKKGSARDSKRHLDGSQHERTARSHRL